MCDANAIIVRMRCKIRCPRFKVPRNDEEREKMLTLRRRHDRSEQSPWREPVFRRTEPALRVAPPHAQSVLLLYACAGTRASRRSPRRRRRRGRKTCERRRVIRGDRCRERPVRDELLLLGCRTTTAFGLRVGDAGMRGRRGRAGSSRECQTDGIEEAGLARTRARACAGARQRAAC